MKLRNPFIRRIARHLNVSTLFRRPDSAADEAAPRTAHLPGLRSGEASPAIATILPEPQMQSLPLGYAAGDTNISHPLIAAYSQADDTQLLEDRIQQAERYTQHASQRVQTAPVPQKSVQPVVRPSAAPVRPPSAQPEPGTPTDALTREWPRLQAIMRGHEAVQNTTVENPPVLAAAQGIPTSQPRIHNLPSKPVVTELDQKQSGRKPVSLTTGVPVQTSSSSVLQTPVQAQLESADLTVSPETVPVPFDDRLSEQAEPVSTTVLQTESHRTPVDLPSQQAAETRLDDTVPAFQTAGLIRGEAQTPLSKAVNAQEPSNTLPFNQTTALGGPAAQIEPLDETPTLTPRQTASEAFERIPLQEAWPVQRQVETPLTAMAANQPLEAEESTLVPPDPQQIRQIEEALKGVAVSQPTDSKVELITPRRPRPGSALQAKPLSSPAGAPLPFDQAPAGDFELPENQRVETVIQQAPAAPRPQTRRDSPDDPTAVPPQMVETEIGPLPADLWQLMGTEPPAQRIISPGSPAANPDVNPVENPVENRSDHHAKGLAGQPSIFDVTAPPGFEGVSQRESQSDSPARQSETPLHNVTPMIQRAIQIGEVETGVTPETAGGETNPSSGGQAAGSAQSRGEQQQNAQLSPAAIDKLVREVYAQIKRRFSVERERLHKD